jgi:predicted house-cleaning NTP pyrophosphatase (Maf/HAM1 superfamily)
MSLLAWTGAIKALVESNRLRIVLASASPRRKEILGSLLLSESLFSVMTSGFEETLPKDQFSFAGDYALATARGKALEVAEKLGKPEPGKSSSGFLVWRH